MYVTNWKQTGPLACLSLSSVCFWWVKIRCLDFVLPNEMKAKSKKSFILMFECVNNHYYYSIKYWRNW